MVRIGAAMLLLFLGVYAFAPLPDAERSTGDQFPGAPLLLRALVGPFHTLAADRYWLLSARESMTFGRGRADPHFVPFMRAARLVVTLDPRFDGALRYATTYLSSIHRLVDDANDLCDIAIELVPDQTTPYVLKIVNEVGYHYPERRQRVIAWMKQLTTATGSVPPWLPGLLTYIRRQQGRQALVQQDLHWLAQNTRDPKARAAILAHAAALAEKRSSPGD